MSNRILAELARQLAVGELAAKDVLAVLELGNYPEIAARHRTIWPISTILYYLGSAIVFMGLAFFIDQQWAQFGTPMRVLVTLGTAVSALLTGVLLDQQQQLGAVGNAAFLLSGLLLPVGLIVTFDELGLQVSSLVLQLEILGLLSVVYLASFALLRKTVLLIFALLFGTCCCFAAIDVLVGNTPTLDPFTLASYQLLGVGLAWAFLGHGLSLGAHRILSGWLYGIGIASFLGAALALGEWQPNQNLFWEIVYPGLVFAVIFLGTQLKSRTFLVFGSLALGSYLSKITLEYFADSLGWAVALILVGFLLMAVAFLALHLQRQFISNE